MTWRDLIRRAWRAWRTSRRTFPPDCEHCGEFMVPREVFICGHIRTEWDCAQHACRVIEIAKLGNVAPPSRLELIPR
jgi:hypothetical protein